MTFRASARIARLAAVAATFVMLDASAAEPRLAAFTTDGCSLFPDRAPVGNADWCHCCLAHDLAYWRGGTKEDKLRADEALRTCVRGATGDKALADVMFTGVQTAGGPQYNTPYRWGYGWPYGKGYAALTPRESALADQLEREYRAANPALVCPRAEPVKVSK